MWSEAKALSTEAMSLAQKAPAHKPLHTGWYVGGAVTAGLKLLPSLQNTLRNRTLGWMVPCSCSWDLLCYLLNCLFFFPGRWAVFTDCEHQGLLISEHEGSCDLHLPYVLLLFLLGFKRNHVWWKLHGGKSFPTEGKATSKLPARQNKLHKFLSEVDFTLSTRHNSNLLIFSRGYNCRCLLVTHLHVIGILDAVKFS